MSIRNTSATQHTGGPSDDKLKTTGRLAARLSSFIISAIQPERLTEERGEDSTS